MPKLNTKTVSKMSQAKIAASNLLTQQIGDIAPTSSLSVQDEQLAFAQ